MLPPDDDPAENRADELARKIETLLVSEMSDVAIGALTGAFIRLLIGYDFKGEEAAAVIEDVSSTTLASFRDFEVLAAAYDDVDDPGRLH
ncbi:hypothetical protein [Paradevosia shaoguanensis]|uniref:Uncharacterized protein n=1 Tax=Paradevosia shaoguanensis TaxID=1335043 RepID=A0AA41QQV2_9HYPH|nr:hypothetical protein [Paradevosia shaoguanensis]MCF1744641.1 hypothetical protein [Paradevosia shaoguanensis]MCI0129124.1 hypothetical protein [Paradevosia shaoguanensis]